MKRFPWKGLPEDGRLPLVLVATLGLLGGLLLLIPIGSCERSAGQGCGRDQGQKLRTDLRSPARAAMIPSSDTPQVSGQCQGLQPAGTPILGPTQPGYGKTPN